MLYLQKKNQQKKSDIYPSQPMAGSRLISPFQAELEAAWTMRVV